MLILKFKMAPISSFLKLSQHSTGAECDKEQFAENCFSISLFINEIIQINESSRWLPGGHLVFPITTNFIYDHLEISTNTCVKFHDYTTRSFRVVRRT